ncbi:CLK4-associating serine/arginine rich protein isoform X1 [Leguminivora glycinivorella]|uniref:CLK4-associating serine/arginine rich protein isoform X1 n=1 Tax=Leguminivora glycinivorella TaxID=1035111 RepID=UPI0020100FBE|nr:CLK4-associating serine/arginine rich protein isoform X1 [Leguminivora glycinivorella]
MWHEARKQEKMIRGMIVDYRRRAERRKDFYEKIKAEPTQFLQLHGRPCKIHLDPAIAAAGEGPAIMMPWQGDTSNMIDRFDVRAHLDYIPEVKNPYVAPEDLSQEERQCNYESYRILAQNAFLGISEEKFLQQLAIEEQFGVTIEEKEMQKERLNEKKGTGAAIGYNYNDPGAQPSCSNPTGPDVKKTEQEDSDDDSDLEIIDVDLSIDVNKMEASQAHELNSVGPLFGMAGCDLFSFLTGDADDAEHQKQLLREEKEKAMFSGRKSRKERRAHRDKKLQHRVVSPPAYAAPRTNSETARSVSRSASRSPEPAPQIEFITSFGQDDDEVKPPPPIKPLYADKLKKNLKPEVLYSDVARKPPARSPPQYNDYQGPRPFMGPHRPRSRSRSRSRSYSRSVSRSRSKSRSRSRSRYSSSRSRSYSPQRRSRSASRPRQYRNRRSRSPPNYGKRNRSRSISYESNDKGATKAAMPRYYGRRKEDKSSSELSLDSDSSDTPDDGKRTSAVKSNTNQNQLRLTGSSSKGSSRQTNSLKEKLKKKMQAQLSRQLRADKRAEAERLERESRRQARRDEEMRELAIKLRRSVKCGISRTEGLAMTIRMQVTVDRLEIRQREKRRRTRAAAREAPRRRRRRFRSGRPTGTRPACRRPSTGTATTTPPTPSTARPRPTRRPARPAATTTATTTRTTTSRPGGTRTTRARGGGPTGTGAGTAGTARASTSTSTSPPTGARARRRPRCLSTTTATATLPAGTGTKSSWSIIRLPRLYIRCQIR